MPKGKPSDTFFQANAVGVDFIRNDLETALTFAQIAKRSHEAEKTVRNRRNARRGYNTVVRFLTRTTLTADQQQDIDEKLDRLRSALAELGESFG